MPYMKKGIRMQKIAMRICLHFQPTPIKQSLYTSCCWIFFIIILLKRLNFFLLRSSRYIFRCYPSAYYMAHRIFKKQRNCHRYIQTRICKSFLRIHIGCSIESLLHHWIILQIAMQALPAQKEAFVLHCFAFKHHSSQSPYASECLCLYAKKVPISRELLFSLARFYD